ncbi:IS5 family transposase [Streptomyces sp. NPDC015661]|uniref:IS5 family transposase n=1 Tax=Streptomyces sp. NPDC015661 TaxID=3364961 RepID=UPI0036FEBDFE
MTDAEWAVARTILPVPAWMDGRGGRPESYCHRQMVDAVRYLVDNGIKWRAMPADLPPWDRVYAFFRRWRDNALIKEFHDRLRERVREAEGRDAEPTAGIVDSQSVKGDAVVGAASRGFDGGKLVNGRKRHLVVDCLGLVLAVLVTPASVTDRNAACGMLPALRECLPRRQSVTARLFEHGHDPSVVRAENVDLDPVLPAGHHPPSPGRRRGRRVVHHRLTNRLRLGRPCSLGGLGTSQLGQRLEILLQADHPAVQHLFRVGESRPLEFGTQFLHSRQRGPLTALHHSPHRRHPPPHVIHDESDGPSLPRQRAHHT